MESKSVDLEQDPKDNIKKLSTLSSTKAFLGQEFLTWLWYRAETEPKNFVVLRANESEELRFELWVDDRIFLQSVDREGHENLLRGGDPSRSDEAAASLASGKVVRELKVGMHIEGYGDYTAVVNASDLLPKTLHVPEEKNQAWDGEEPDPASLIIYRLDQIERFIEAFDGLFLNFLNDRASSAWEPQTLRSIRAWISSRHAGKTKTTIH